MPPPILHKLMALSMVFLLLLQYAPVLPLWNPPTHAASCTHCNGSFCPLEAKNHGAGDHRHAMMAPSQDDAHQHAMQGVHTSHQHNTVASGATNPHAESRLCSCDHGRGLGAFLIVLDKTVATEPLQATRPSLLLSHPVLMEVVTLDRFATDLFRPPRTLV